MLTDPNEVAAQLRWIRMDLRARILAAWWHLLINVTMGMVCLVCAAYLCSQATQRLPLLYGAGAALNVFSSYRSLSFVQRELGIWLWGWRAIRQLQRRLAELSDGR